MCIVPMSIAVLLNINTGGDSKQIRLIRAELGAKVYLSLTSYMCTHGRGAVKQPIPSTLPVAAGWIVLLEDGKV